MTSIAGTFLIILAILVICFGDRNIKAKESKVVQAISMPVVNVKFVKWACGIVLIWIGLALIFLGK